jgi:hypothetical protein
MPGMSVNLFEKMPIQQALQGIGTRPENIDFNNQLNQFNSILNRTLVAIGIK